MAGLPPDEGARFFVQYQGDALFHERLVVGVIDAAAQMYMVVTPDWDEYEEQLTPNRDIAQVLAAGQRGGVPRGAGPLCRFDGLTAARVRELVVGAVDRVDAARHAVARRAGPDARAVLPMADAPRVPEAPADQVVGAAGAGGAVVAAAPPAAAGGAVDPNLRWRLLEKAGSLAAGDPIVPSGGAISLASRALDEVQGRVVALAISPADEDKEAFLARTFGGAAAVVDASVDARTLSIYVRAGDNKRERGPGTTSATPWQSPVWSSSRSRGLARCCGAYVSFSANPCIQTITT